MGYFKVKFHLMKRIYIIIYICLILPLSVIEAGNVKLNNLRYFTYDNYTRFVLDLSAPIKIIAKSLPGKKNFRLYFDLKNCSFGKNYPEAKSKEINFNMGHLKKIRIGKRGSNTLRVVFNFTAVEKYNLFYLKAPYRIVLDFFENSKEFANKQTAEKGLTITRVPEQINGRYSISRQLGLGVKTIIIDPGHGGKDPGTMNLKYHLYEKHIVLDISKRLKNLFKKNDGINVILTRDSDKYISLEERTAISNSKRGDIFISIHVNSAPRKKVNGIETYYLSMTTDPHAIRVAAQENAVSKTSLTKLNSIVDKIIKNAKIEESIVLARTVQKGILKKVRSNYKQVTDLGVKKAPFYVLVGAEMPSILIETSFLSNRVEAERLKRGPYRQTLAEGIYLGIIKYIKTLGKI